MFRMFSRYACVLVLSFTALSTGCADDEGTSAARAPARCEQLREHLADMRVASVTVDQEQHRRAIARSLDPLIASCASFTDEAIDCALDAASSDDAARCLATAR